MLKTSQINFKTLIPLVIFMILGVLMWKGLDLNPNDIPSAMIGKSVPSFQQQKLENIEEWVDQNIFDGKVSILNVWASWCGYCRVEHDFILEQSQKDGIQWVGLNYKDTTHDARTWLNQLGNPYRFSILDPKGKLAINLGVLGTPETFVIDANKVIRYRYSGPLDKEVWEEKILPVLKTINS